MVSDCPIVYILSVKEHVQSYLIPSITMSSVSKVCPAFRYVLLCIAELVVKLTRHISIPTAAASAER